MPPGPFPYPIIGNVPHILCDPVKPLDKLADQYGDIYTLSFPNDVHMVVLNTAKLARETRVGTSDSLAGKLENSFYPFTEILRPNLTTTDYSPELKFRRTVFKSAMHIYGSGTEKASEFARRAVDIVTNEVVKKEGEPFSPREILESSIFVQLWEWLTAKKLQLNDPIVKCLSRFNEIFAKQMSLSSVSQVLPFFKYLPTQAKREINEAKEIRRTIFPKEYNAHKLTYTTGNTRDLTDDFISSYENDIGKETGRCFGSMDDIAGLMADVIVGGADTTSSSISWLLLYLILNPDIQENVHKEIDAVLGTDRVINWKDSQAMPYMQATLCEVQRASGMITMVGTNTIRDMTIGGYHIPKGAFVALNLGKIHHDPLEWSEPDRFQPERFLDSDGKFIGWNKLRGFLPFGIGRRECPGQSFAKIVLFVFTSIFLRRFRVELPEGEDIPNVDEYEPGIVKRPKKFKIVMKKRKD